MKVTIIGSNGFLAKSIASYSNRNNFDFRSIPRTPIIVQIGHRTSENVAKTKD